MRISNRTIVWAGLTHVVPKDWDLIIRCRLKLGDKILQPWGEWKRIPKNMHGTSTNIGYRWNGTYVIRRRPQVDLKIQNLIDISLSSCVDR